MRYECNGKRYENNHAMFPENYQWEFQDPKIEVLYHIRPYFVGIFPSTKMISIGWQECRQLASRDRNKNRYKSLFQVKLHMKKKRMYQECMRVYIL